MSMEEKLMQLQSRLGYLERIFKIANPDISRSLRVRCFVNIDSAKVSIVGYTIEDILWHLTAYLKKNIGLPTIDLRLISVRVPEANECPSIVKTKDAFYSYFLVNGKVDRRKLDIKDLGEFINKDIDFEKKIEISVTKKRYQYLTEKGAHDYDFNIFKDLPNGNEQVITKIKEVRLRDRVPESLKYLLDKVNLRSEKARTKLMILLPVCFRN